MERTLVNDPKKVSLSAPWVIYFRMIEAMFKRDPRVKVVLDSSDGANQEIKIYVEGDSKAEAIQKLLPDEKTFGNVSVRVTVYPANTTSTSKSTLIERAFDGNPVLTQVIRTNLWDNPVEYIVFEKSVVQYFNDDLSDYHGMCSTLYAELAKELFGEETNIFFCTDSDNVPNSEEEDDTPEE